MARSASTALLKRISFYDYKSFAQFDISLRKRNILVGPNNSGKSSALDALRLTFDVLRYAKRRNPNLKSQGENGICATYFVPQTAIDVDVRTCMRDFEADQARIVLEMTSGAKLTLRIRPEHDVEAFVISSKEPYKATSFLPQQIPLDIIVVPTLSPLERTEESVTPKTVEINQFSRLASRNFRNYWRQKTRAQFDELNGMIGPAWGGIHIMYPEVAHVDGRAIVQIFFRDGGKVREVQWAGFGFQVWLQTMTHLLRANQSSLLVLDEPDIYLHPDLQRRLMRIVEKRVGQFIVATHSTEIINDADAGDILMVQPASRSAKRVKTESDYGEMFSLLGSSENAQFARLAKTKRVLYVEGSDRRLYERLARVIGEDLLFSDEETTFMRTEGFSNWERVPSTAWVFNKMFDFDVKVAAFFDRDYRCNEEVESFLASVGSENTFCRVLPCKEIENIFLREHAIERVVEKFVDVSKYPNWNRDLRVIIDSAVEDEKSEVLACRIGEKVRYLHKTNPHFDPTTIAKSEKGFFELAWASTEFRLNVVPGKQVLSTIAGRVKQELDVSLTTARIGSEMKPTELSPEFISILHELRAFYSV